MAIFADEAATLLEKVCKDTEPSIENQLMILEFLKLLTSELRETNGRVMALEDDLRDRNIPLAKASIDALRVELRRKIDTAEKSALEGKAVDCTKCPHFYQYSRWTDCTLGPEGCDKRQNERRIREKYRQLRIL